MTTGIAASGFVLSYTRGIIFHCLNFIVTKTQKQFNRKNNTQTVCERAVITKNNTLQTTLGETKLLNIFYRILLYLDIALIYKL